MLDCNETSALFYHRFLESCKFAFGLRCLVGDDNFTDSTSVSDDMILKRILIYMAIFFIEIFC